MRSFSISTFIVAALLMAIAGCQAEKKDVTSDVAPTPNDQPAVTTVSFANDRCPIMGGKKLDPELAVDWNGNTIGFCCDGCPQKWEKLTDEEKAEKFTALTLSPQSAHDIDSDEHDGHDKQGEHSNHDADQTPGEHPELGQKHDTSDEHK